MDLLPRAQILAGMGFLVLYMNPRGSDGYGERFRREVVRDWEARITSISMTAVDQLLKGRGRWTRAAWASAAGLTAGT